MGFYYTFDRSRTTGFKCNYLRASLLTVLRVACTKSRNAGMPECRNAGILKPGTQNY